LSDVATIDPQESRSYLSNALLVIISFLLCFGALMVFSAGASLDQDFDIFHFWRYATLRRVAFVPIVWLVLAIGSFISYRWLLGAEKKWSHSPIFWLLALTVVSLVLVLIPGIGSEVNQSRRWLKLGPPEYGLTFQPSELAKWITVLFLAAYCHWRGEAGMKKFFSGFLPALAVLLAVVGLIGKEDFGTAALVGAAGAMILLVGGARWWHMLILIPLACVAFYFLVYCNDYRWARVMAHVHGGREGTSATAYQAQQSLMTISSGGIWGVGLGKGTIKLGWLPEDTTDFIFAVIGEELGFAGCAVVIGLYFAFVLCGLRIAFTCRDRLGSLTALGITGTLGSQVAMNLLVVTGLAPTKGIALPFISAGGSGLVVTALAVSVLVNVAKKSAVPS